MSIRREGYPFIIGAALGFMILGALGLALNLSPGAVILMGVLGAVVVGLLFYGVRDLFVMLATAFSGATQVVYGLGLLLPALAKAKARAQRINCTSNLKQWGIAVVMYAGDNRDSFPDNAGGSGFPRITPGLYRCPLPPGLQAADLRAEEDLRPQASGLRRAASSGSRRRESSLEPEA